jgi:hypothetical protein
LSPRQPEPRACWSETTCLLEQPNYALRCGEPYGRRPKRPKPKRDPRCSRSVRRERRLCVGGPLALTAIARSHSRRKDSSPDCIFLIQERSARVLNAPGRLAVIPKAFHQPLVDFSHDAQISPTLEREMEEELFGRPEVDSTDQVHRSADPMHISRLSEPMRWLIDRANTGTWRIECVGFGINAVSGNFECASLIVINDDRW